MDSRAKRKKTFKPDKELPGLFLMDYRNAWHYRHYTVLSKLAIVQELQK